MCGLAHLVFSFHFDEWNGIKIFGFLQFVVRDISKIVVFFVFLVLEKLVGLPLDEGKGAVGLGLISHLTII